MMVVVIRVPAKGATRWRMEATCSLVCWAGVMSGTSELSMSQTHTHVPSVTNTCSLIHAQRNTDKENLINRIDHIFRFLLLYNNTIYPFIMVWLHLLLGAFATLFLIFVEIKSLNLNQTLRINQINGQTGRECRKRETKTEAENKKNEDKAAA